jgi:uncharacterized protein YcfJ
MKTSIIYGAVFALSTSAALANQSVSDVKVFHHTVDVLTDVTTERYICETREIPLYSEGEANLGDFLTGAIIGGLIGGTATESDKGAAIGAFTGGVIAAEKGKKRIVGYRTEEICNPRQVTTQERTAVYSYSTIRFYMNGKRYVLRFER